MVCFHMVTDCDCNEAHQILEDTSTSIRRMWGYTHLRSDMDEDHKMFANNIVLKGGAKNNKNNKSLHICPKVHVQCMNYLIK